MNYIIFTDGGSRGNPGPSGAGGIIRHPDGTVVAKISQFLGHQTNNYAEYKALYLTLCEAIKLNIVDVDVYLDSKLIVEQLNGRWKVKTLGIIPLYTETKNLIANFKSITFSHVYRKYNKEADALANQAMDLGILNLQCDTMKKDK